MLRVVRGREDLDFENEEPRSKRMRTEFLEIYLASLDKAWAAKVKKEECFKDLKGDRQERFLQAIRKEIQNNMDTKAYNAEPRGIRKSPKGSSREDCQVKVCSHRKEYRADDIEKAKKDSKESYDEKMEKTARRQRLGM